MRVRRAWFSCHGPRRSFPTRRSSDLGAGVTVGSTTVVSPTQLSVALAIEATAAMGPRDVTVSNPDGQSVVLTGGFTVTPTPAAHTPELHAPLQLVCRLSLEENNADDE